MPLEVASSHNRRVRVGDRVVDLDRLEVTSPSIDALPLSATEGRLLEVLLAHGGRPVPPDALLRDVWGIRDGQRTKLVDKAVYRLRAKLESEPKEPLFLKTVRGRGLLLDAERMSEPARDDRPAAPVAAVADLLQVPAFGIGSLGGNFYRPNEWVDIDDLVKLVAVSIRTISAWSELA